MRFFKFGSLISAAAETSVRTEGNSMDELLHTTMTIGPDHLGHAIELLYMSKREPEKRVVPRLSTSSIIHSFAGMEASINSLAYNMFSNTQSTLYMPTGERDYLIEKQIRSWDTTGIIDKILFILSRFKSELPPNLQARIREINTLRNWILHGLCYGRTYLINQEERSEGVYEVVDFEDHINWQGKFPHMKFSNLLEMKPSDAENCLRTILEALLITTIETKYPLSLHWYLPSPRYVVIHGDMDIEELLQQI